MNGLLPIGPADSKRQLLEAATVLRRVVEFLPLCAVVPRHACVPVFSSAAAAVIRNRCDPELLCYRNAVWPGSGVSVFRAIQFRSSSFQQFSMSIPQGARSWSGNSVRKSGTGGAP
ncbi:hypothetical protein [Streptomyces kronopolitis]|uniref:hypothetical protein n=1 Tax=Streptomyces kronopolitis TaxID=1612435 RepID=UPI00344AA161